VTNHNPLAHDLDEILAATRSLWPELRGRNIFITGATGFFGCWLLESFTWANRRFDLNARATILTRNPEKLQQRLPHLDRTNIEIVAGDICDFRFPNGEFTHVIHAATESSAELNAKQPQVMFDTIVEGTRRCLDFAAHAGTRKFLFTSSGAVYGKQPPEFAHMPEEFAGCPDSLNPNSAYGEGKRAAELLCALTAKRNGLEAKIARCFAFVGPYMKLDAHFAIGNFIRDRLAGDRIVVRGDGTPVRSYMYASDLMIWLWTILFRGESRRAYNVGAEEGINIAALAREVAAAPMPMRETGRSQTTCMPVETVGTSVPGAPIARYVPCTARAQKELGLGCSVLLADAIARTLAYCAQQNAVVVETGEVAR
jgi:dTDP-glucose 4,6-dehydratase